MRAAANQPTISFRPSRGPANPPPIHRQLSLTRESLTSGTRWSGATSHPFFFFLFPLSAVFSPSRGRRLGKARPCGHGRRPGCHPRVLEPYLPSILPTAAARGSNPSQLGFLPPNPPPVTSRRRVRGGAGGGGVRSWERAILRQAGAVRDGGAGPDHRSARPSSVSSTPRRRLLPRR
jgi:hypothetical protein